MVLEKDLYLFVIITFFQISKLRRNPNSNKAKYFNFSKVQIQIAGKNFEPWLINKYLPFSKNFHHEVKDLFQSNFVKIYEILMNKSFHNNKIHWECHFHQCLNLEK